ncbi:apolipoprotein N-acyltransferase [Opitutales bacterium]|nr:apolipoprotein N-acyltransferase [Opitutales bacterium]
MRTFYHSYRLDCILFFKTWSPGILATGSTFLLLYLAQPPGEFPEAAYFFLVPLLVWLYFEPKSKAIYVSLILSGFIYNIGLIGWIRHVSPVGMLLACLVVTIYQLPWFIIASRWVYKCADGPFGVRFSGIFGLSALWVTIEWARSLFPLGFPWCPLSVTQWERPALLQLVPYAGGWIVSFFLVFFNLCLASYLHHLLVRRRRQDRSGYFSSMCPDFYICMAFFLIMLLPLILRSKKSELAESVSVKVGVCQPYLLNKWAPENIAHNKRTLIEQTNVLSSLRPDLIVWPEASTPYAVNLDRGWVEKLSKEGDTPILAGAIIKENELSYNSVVKIDPLHGLEQEWYAKQVLVPFGEHIPAPLSLIPGLTRLVGPVGNFTQGNCFHSFTVANEYNQTISIVPVICYEDIFPGLVKDVPVNQNTLLFVTTNDAWFGEEGCAEQHASHSVIRALELGVSVLRCGNAGWSGWISPNGVIREVMRDQDESVYFQGASVLEISVPPSKNTFYSKRGDYFVALCLVLVIFSSYFIQKIKPTAFRPI